MSKLQPSSNLNIIEPQFEARSRNAVWIAVVTGVVMLLITAVVLPDVIRLGTNRIWGPLITTLAAVASFTSALISAKGRPNLGGGILVSTILILSMFAILLFEQNQGIALSAIVVFVVSTIAFYTLPESWVGRVTVLSVVVGFLNILADLYLPNFGLPNDPRYTNTMGVVISVVYLVIILRRFDQFALRTKLVAAFILISLVPVILLGIQSTIITRNNITQQVNTDLIETAQTAAQYIDTVLNNEFNAIRSEAEILDLIDYLALPASLRPGSAEEVRASTTLLALKRKNAVFISSYALLDKNGIDVLDTFRNDIGVSKADRNYFRVPFEDGTPYISPIRISPSTLQPSIYFSAPVRDQNGKIIGVLRSRYKARFLQNLLYQSISSEQEEFAALVDNETYVRIANTGDELLNYKAYGNLSEAEIKNLQAQFRLLPGTSEEVLAPEPKVMDGIRNLENQSLFTAPSIIYGGENTYAGGVRLKKANWVILIQRTEDSVLAPIEDQTRSITLVLLLVISLAAGAGFLASQVLARPMLQLTNVAGDIANGNLSTRVVLKTQDEVGALANSFNQMTSRLQDTLSGLESRVAERTADLEMARLLSERRAQELQSISDISRIISSEQKLETLLALISRLVSEKFDFYHVGIFLLDSTHQYAVLQAANSEGGQKMLARGHRLEAGQMGIVGNVARSGEPRITLDVGADAVYFDNPDLPLTRSEMALPLNVRGETIGVLDVQSTKPGAFTENDIKTLSILADQISIAIDNARLFGQNKQALDEVQSLYDQYLRQEWKTFIQNRLKIGYIQSMGSGKPLEFRVESDEIERTLQNGQIVVTGANEKSFPSVSVPIKLRGQIIGVLNIKAPTKDRRWNQDEINLAQVISDRLALALDNARLLFESQRQTAKEQKIGEVTAKIGASINMRNVLQTAVEELGRALPGSEVVIQFQNNGNQE
ncbi:MAG: GAF domain-containing protein [Chloroflexota bacterium]